jgi:hypothetical protein
VRIVAAALCVVVSFGTMVHRARAACPIPDGADAALAYRDDAERLAWIDREMRHTAHKAKVWEWGWGIGIVGATAIDLAMIPILGDTRSNRIDFGIGAATTIVGLLPLVVLPPRVIHDRRALDIEIERDGTNCTVLADAERRLRADARNARQSRAWYMHAANVVFNAAVFFLFGADGHWFSGALNGVGGAIVGELIIYTQPIDDIAALRRYEKGDLGEPKTRTSWTISPILTSRGIGFGLTVEF